MVSKGGKLNEINKKFFESEDEFGEGVTMSLNFYSEI